MCGNRDLHFFFRENESACQHRVSPFSNYFFFSKRNYIIWETIWFVLLSSILKKSDVWVSTGSRLPKYSQDLSAICDFQNCEGLAVLDLNDTNVIKRHFIKFHRQEEFVGHEIALGRVQISVLRYKIKTSVAGKQARLWILLSWYTPNCSK